MESSHLVIFLTSGKFITKFNVLRCVALRCVALRCVALRCVSLSETLFWTGGQGSNTNHLNGLLISFGK